MKPNRYKRDALQQFNFIDNLRRLADERDINLTCWCDYEIIASFWVAEPIDTQEDDHEEAWIQFLKDLGDVTKAKVNLLDEIDALRKS